MTLPVIRNVLRSRPQKVGLLWKLNGRRFLATETVSTPQPVAPTLTKEQAKKREIKRLALKKAEARKPASTHPLYMSVPLALRYLRAAEVGRPAQHQTITATTLVVADKGNAALAGNVLYPHPLKQMKIGVFSNNAELLEKLKERYGQQIAISGGEELIANIKAGKTRVDGLGKVFATPEIFPAIASQLGRVLGPRGLMPNLKKQHQNTVGEDLESLIEQNLGLVSFRQRGNNISVSVGRCSFSDKDIIENLIAIRNAYKQSLATQVAKKPSILGKTTLSTTLGPGIVIDFV
ncbi:mitochondrial 54S ribosomal protein uL1m [Nakaseomyces bracarensis]|uniref:mitochondrial 54S ribosomal protein uL1m n=1 Tax=Nakaseomyces bracarensis TaxID=273131 RepID=UPI0038719568